MTKPLHCGNAARNGVLAAMLGKSGFTANPAAFEGRNGYFQSFSRGIEVSLEGFKDLGRRYDLVAGRHRFKPYPCGGLTHTSIEAALDLRKQVAGRFDDVKNIHCCVARAGWPARVHRLSDRRPSRRSSASAISCLMRWCTARRGSRLSPRRRWRTTRSGRCSPRSPPPSIPNWAAATTTARPNPHHHERRPDVRACARISQPAPTCCRCRRMQFEAKFLDCAALVMDVERGKRIFAILNELPGRASFADFWPLFRKA